MVGNVSLGTGSVASFGSLWVRIASGLTKNDFFCHIAFSLWPCLEFSRCVKRCVGFKQLNSSCSLNFFPRGPNLLLNNAGNAPLVAKMVSTVGWRLAQSFVISANAWIHG